ncbi:eukaryotic aspartyl protease [Colletotrichum graminicola M1.001]|uniref:Eukaryotic aspartyl protease n=1 Tax=Colletotrichum graminicola (strain M1.001 / M2 / FGSC 10212) TaxID=645133 RepID=E3QL78_COLGM|nr:eukaryotic aspartyl protease [Colletotrichum graminicola M1.001]EFQ31616.1 eukaryotic aspartyl protease [Colletotrichum graminicola M1.001]
MLLSLVVPLLWSVMAHAIPTGPPASGPQPGTLPSSTFTIPVRANPDYVPDGAALAAAYEKWNMPVPEALAKHTLTRRSGYYCKFPSTPLLSSIVAARATGNFWLTDVFVGNPENPQKIPVIIDTGSSDFWLMTTDTKFGDKAAKGLPILYDPSKSTSSQEVSGATWSVSYGDGVTNSGKVYLDTVRFGLLTDNNRFNIINATIQSVVNVGQRWAVEPQISGVLGIAKNRPSSVQPSRPSMLDLLKPELHFEWIGIDLRHESNKGFFSFGYAMGTASINEKPMDSEEGWSFQISKTRMSTMDGGVWFRFSSPFTAIIDTATSFLMLPPSLVVKYYSEIPDSALDPDLGLYIFPCSLASGIPDFQFISAGGYVGTVPKEHINLGPVPGNTDKCYGGIQKSSDANRVIFGSVALKSMYVQLNYGAQGSYVGFGDKGSLDVCSATSACDA